MNAASKNNLLYAFSVLLLLSACVWVRSITGIESTPVPLPGDTPATETAVIPRPTASPTAAPGSFADFHGFAADIAAALQDRNASFFEDHAASSAWECLGDETFGVCKGVPSGTTLEGIPVAYDWATYEVIPRENYSEAWQTRFAGDKTLKLAAIANQLGDNPLMPMAGQSFLAIVAVPNDNDPPSIQEVRVLFFEYYENTWHLAGELVTVENTDSWLNDTCPTCYDVWEAWPQ